MLAVIREHIEATPGVCGGRPRIAGHRVRVMDIVVLHEQLVSTYPTLTLADVHAALAYYFDHREEIQGDLARDRETAEALRRQTPSHLQDKLKHLRGR